jgi:hypothetical protein
LRSVILLLQALLSSALSTSRFLATRDCTMAPSLMKFSSSTKRNKITISHEGFNYQLFPHWYSRSFTIPRVHREGMEDDMDHTLFFKEEDKKEEGSTSLIEAPTVKNIIRFAIPAIGIWLCGPLLSLIDTSAVGMLSGTSQQAALNPAITITDDGALLVVSM